MTFYTPIGSPNGAEAYILGFIIDEYEQKTIPAEVPDPIETIYILMEYTHRKKS